MRRIGAVLAALVLVAWVLVVAPPRAYASGAPITTMDVDVAIATDGTLTVTQTFDMNFVSPGHGPYLYFTTRQKTDQATRYRVYDYDVTGVSSPTGASAQYDVETPSYGVMTVKIGDPDVYVYDTQRYVVTYTVAGASNPNASGSGLDELFWNVIGQAEVPVSDVTVTLTSPATVSTVACWTGSDFDRPCTSSASTGTTATYTQTTLSTGQGLAIVAGWPLGTLTAADARYETHFGPLSDANTSPVAWGAAGVVVLGSVGALLVGRRRRDEVYVGLPPGTVPAPGQTVATTRVATIPYAVQFTPPAGISPSMIGTLFDEAADAKEVSATLVDLAVRGYWRLEQHAADGDVTIVKLKPAEGLTEVETLLYTALFPYSDSVRVTGATLRSSSDFGSALEQMKRALYESVVAAGWFRRDPQYARALRVGIGIAVATVSVVLGIVFRVVPVIVTGVLAGAALVVSYRWVVARTALGSAVASQALGFKQYLETAEADQIRWEEGEDIFSRYLPYAVAFGCADRWMTIVSELAAKGMIAQGPSWYEGPGWAGVHTDAWVSASFGSIVGSLDGFSASATSAMTMASAGSSGGSGFSSGGYSGGGGGGTGGGGIGSW